MWCARCAGTASAGRELSAAAPAPTRMRQRTGRFLTCRVVVIDAQAKHMVGPAVHPTPGH